MERALLVLSGGQDSTTCGFWALQQGCKELHAVTFDYKQRHSVEVEAACKIADILDAQSHELLYMGGSVLAGTSPLTNPDEELEQYENYTVLPGGLEKTFVPARNMLFLTLAANRAYCLGIEHIITGVCQEDSGGYPDCRRTFIDSVEGALNTGLYTGEGHAPGNVTIHTPLMDLTKKQSVELARDLPGCYAALAYSHTSYDGAYPPNGHDHATLLRAKGFDEANVPDPLILRANKEGLMSLPDSPAYKQDMAPFLEEAGLL